ncbi:MAG: aspartate--tRNA(Asn) ligase [Roseburia sp.]|nr:aspartate--tRNA(Asn) ligase [Roseburia sp.]
MEFIDYEKEFDTKDIQGVIERFSAGSLNDGEKIQVHGVIHRIRHMSGFAFVIIRSPRILFQCVWEENTSQVDLKQFSTEDCVNIEGTVVFEERSKLGFDIRIDKMEKLSGAAEQIPIEISNDKKVAALQLNTLLDHRIITLRSSRVRAAIKLGEGVMHAFRDFLDDENFTEFVPPRIVQAGAEGGADMFEVDYFGEKAYLNQSPQMYKQIMVGAFSKVYTVGPIFRGEKHSTNRHINEFQGLDIEMGFIDSFEDIMELEARLFKYMFRYLNENYAYELDILLGRDKRLPELTKFPKVRFSEVKDMYAKANNVPVDNPNDLCPDEEKWIGEYFMSEYNAPIVFITHYPSAKRPFYTMDDPQDPDVTLSYDMLLYGLEVTTGGQRIHDYDMQVEKMKQRNMDIADFEDYLTMHKYGMPPHGGFGLGLERIVQRLVGFENIREVTAFPRDRERLRP